MTSVPDPALLKAVAADDSAGSGMSEEVRLLEALGFRRKALGVAQAIADQRGTTMAEELIRLDYLRADAWWAAVARWLGVPYLADLQLAERSPDALLPDARLFRRVRQVWQRTPATTTLVVAPLGAEIDRLSRDIAVDPTLRDRVAIAAPQTIRLAFQRSFEPTLTAQAVGRLKTERPTMSAANGPSLARRIIACVAVALAVSVIFPRMMLTTLDFLFLTAGWLRLAAAVDRANVVQTPILADDELPTYTVLVPLFREAHVIPDLVRALQEIDYPPDKLEMALVVEADDYETVMAARRMTAGSRIRVIAVAPSRPRTKPKALAWSLPFTSGELLTVYDAEDRPARDQLRRAAAAFATAPPDVVCIQAMLDIDHAAASSNWLARQFALEYRVLFRALLPWLAAKRLFLPLGGTSNHFRRDALVDVGAWDPYNVTEDADIAIRIERAGGKIGVLNSETSEEAPVSWRAWHLQRTRWMKGWLQTWLVHMRHPIRLYRDVGFGSFVTFQILILGQVVSTLIYPLGIGLVILDLIGLIPLFADRDFYGDLLLSFQLLALCVGWFGTVAAMISTMGKGGRIVRGLDLVTVPLYWFLLFGAAVSAIIELIVDPHRWNKTRHGVAQRATEQRPPRFPTRLSGEGVPSALPPPQPRPSNAIHRPIAPALLPES